MCCAGRGRGPAKPRGYPPPGRPTRSPAWRSSRCRDGRTPWQRHRAMATLSTLLAPELAQLNASLKYLQVDTGAEPGADCASLGFLPAMTSLEFLTLDANLSRAEQCGFLPTDTANLKQLKLLTAAWRGVEPSKIKRKSPSLQRCFIGRNKCHQ